MDLLTEFLLKARWRVRRKRKRGMLQTNSTIHQLLALISFFAIYILPVHSKQGSSSLSFSSDGCAHPLGLTSGAIKDWQIAASSVISRSVDPHCAVKNARLHSGKNRAWCPKSRSKHEWLLVDLGVKSEISGIITQGRENIKEWVTQFKVSYSLDAQTWEFARDMCGEKKIFKGNSDSHSLRNSYLEHPVEARFVRIHIVDWHKHPSMRLEIIGCQKCNEIISDLPFTEITASSYKPWNRRKSCLPEYGDLNTKKGWCPRKQNEKQWLQFDLGPPKLITGLVTKGLGDRKRFVISYRFSYSNDSFVWYFYQDGKHAKTKTFGGNMDKNTERRHYLNQPVVARYVRFHPVEWNKKIGMRAGVIGCPHTGECGPGFMQVNSGSPCIPNKAYKMRTWSNIEKHSNDNYKYGHSSLAVDGNLDTNLHNCAILDSYHVEHPVWMVDLGKTQMVNGVVILTWQGLGQDEITVYADYVFKLDSLSVYISHKKDLEYYELGPASSKCGTISREKNAIFSPKLHFDCAEPSKGRYLYVKASGKPDRWRKLFTVILCEIMVY